VTGPKTNERPARYRNGRRLTGDDAAPRGTRAQARYVRVSPYKAREVLDLIRGEHVERAREILKFCDRDVALVVDKVVASAVANAEHNDGQTADDLYVSACFADEGPTLKRWRPRARGRATRIRKRMCHITIIVSPMPAEMTAKVEAKRAAGGGTTPSRRGRRGQESRRARVARSRGEAVTPETEAEPTDEMVEEAEEAAAEDEVEDEPTDEAEEEVVAEDEDDESTAEDDDVDPDAEEKK
jgi:large subunit ribosomal protein L22